MSTKRKRGKKFRNNKLNGPHFARVKAARQGLGHHAADVLKNSPAEFLRRPAP